MIPPQIQFKISANPQGDAADIIQDKCQFARQSNFRKDALLVDPTMMFTIKTIISIYYKYVCQILETCL
jgi:hypothetical protein